MGEIETNKYVSRFYKISINFGLVYFYFNSKTFRLRKGILPYLLGFLYSILNIFTGFWGFLGILKKFQGLRNTFSAIHLNISGGEDNTKKEIESNFDDFTVYIYNNIERLSLKEMSLSNVDIILEIQELYSETNSDVYTVANTHFILDNLSKVNINELNKKHIEAVFRSIDIYNKYSLKDRE